MNSLKSLQAYIPAELLGSANKKLSDGRGPFEMDLQVALTAESGTKVYLPCMEVIHMVHKAWLTQQMMRERFDELDAYDLAYISMERAARRHRKTLALSQWGHDFSRPSRLSCWQGERTEQ